MYYRNNCYDRCYPGYDYYYRPRCDDWLVYELINERNRYRDQYLDSLYKIDACNPAYGNFLCRRY